MALPMFTALKAICHVLEKYSSLALEYFEEAGDHRGMINSLNNLSYLARQRQDLESAKELY